MTKPTNLSEDIRKVELAGKLRLLWETAREGYDDNCLLDQARDTIAAELAAKDAEISRLTQECRDWMRVVREDNAAVIAAEDQRNELREENRRLREALGPFAEIGREMEEDGRLGIKGQVERFLDVEDVRRAAKAMEWK